MQELPRKSSFSTPDSYADWMRLFWIFRLFKRNSTGKSLFALMPPTVAAATTTSRGFSRSKKRATGSLCVKSNSEWVRVRIFSYPFSRKSRTTAPPTRPRCPATKIDFSFISKNGTIPAQRGSSFINSIHFAGLAPYLRRMNTAAEFDTIEEAIDEIRAGRMVIVTDDADRENEGDLIMAAEKITPEAVNFMATHGRGLICAPRTEKRAAELGLQRMVLHNRESQKTDFTVSVDAAHGVTTGISASDRAATIRVLVDPAARPNDLVQPGHVFPLQAKDGGVLRRAGHTEASIDLARLAGLPPAGVVCEILHDVAMARLPELLEFKKKHGLKICTIQDLDRKST